MSLSQALNTSLSGLRVTQAALSLVAANVANAQTPGYVRKALVQQSAASGDNGGGVRIATINREIDLYLQRQLRIEAAGGAYASERAGFYRRLQGLYGEPGSASALETVYNAFTSAVQALVTSPESPSVRSSVLSSARVLAQHLNGMSADVQSLRADAESGIADAVATANNAIQKIATLNAQLVSGVSGNAAEASLKDQRDLYIDQLATLMDIRVVVGDHDQLHVFTNSGVQLVGANAAHLVFNSQGTMTAETLWNDDQSKNSVGTLTVVSPSGASVDLLATKAIRSGAIAAYIEMRDVILVQAQNQLDTIAAMMASALSDETIAGDPVASGAQAGFEIDAAGLLAGNRISLTFFDRMTNKEHRVTIVRVDDPAALPLSGGTTVDPNDQVIGIDFSGGMASAVSQLNVLFSGRLEFSNPAGTTLRVLDDGVPNRTDVNAFSVTRTATALAGGGVAFALFTDGATPYSGAVTAIGPQSLGFAGRIAVNPALLADPSRLVSFAAGQQAGDPARPHYIYERLTDAAYSFPSETGIGSEAVPFKGSLPAFLRQMLSMQGEAAASAAGLADGQTVVVNALAQRLDEQSGVNVDQEMANLIALQTAYAANARIMSAIQDMLDVLLRI
jgi:flagellar hook-associated protein 1